LDCKQITMCFSRISWMSVIQNKSMAHMVGGG
jgi:hypothetical protein